MGQLFYGTDPWPSWPIHICWLIWPADPLSSLVRHTVTGTGL